MTNRTKERLSSQTIRRHYATRLAAGLEEVISSPLKRWSFLALLLVLALMFLLRERLVAATVQGVVASMMLDSATVCIPLCGTALLVVVLIAFGTPQGAGKIEDDLNRAGVVNSVDEPPMLLHRYIDPDNPRITILEFRSVGISRTKWEDQQAEVEVALDCYVVAIRDGKSRNRILLHTVPSGEEIPETLPWSEDCMHPDRAVLVLGQTVAGTDVTVDLSKIPHILIGGSTGSGKSVLLKCLLYQCICKDAEVIVADFKGGVDFGQWTQVCTLLLTEEALLECLADLLDTLEIRKQLFRDAGAANIDEYNRVCGRNLRRIVLGCDEVAELLDKTGLEKAQKERVAQVENRLATIARQGRAFGIHLILATQRPDANILSGQIKNNLDCRICGRADNVLSQIVLDCTDAAELIPKDSHRFLMGDGTMFQPYLFDEGV